ncbi:helix-turn-helix domain-containing protein [Sharpea azabuensis]|uniref:helix-turn-helix domain-containing protein n=1 Tax=Sharpea azabuensis TaxID=322505 RepID=UPI00156A3E51|nr:helix-turn-helix transcriptional regulator [Sharpea azabuensis]
MGKSKQDETMEQLKSMIVSRYGGVKQFAEAAGVPRTTIGSLLQGTPDASRFETVSAVCKTLNISMDSLSDGHIEMVGDSRDYGTELGLWLERIAIMLETKKATVDGETISEDKARDVIYIIDAIRKMTGAK